MFAIIGAFLVGGVCGVLLAALLSSGSNADDAAELSQARDAVSQLDARLSVQRRMLQIATDNLVRVYAERDAAREELADMTSSRDEWRALAEERAPAMACTDGERVA